MEIQLKQAVDYFKYIILDELKDVVCWIAGGSCRDYFMGKRIKTDIDIYFPNESEHKKALEYLKLKETKVLWDNERVVRVFYKNRHFDLIKIYFRNPSHTLDNFDFTVCCCAVDNSMVYYHPTFFMDLAKRRIVINKIILPLSTLQRLQKYIWYGFTACNGSLLEIAKAINALDLSDPKKNGIELYPDGSSKFKKLD